MEEEKQDLKVRELRARVESFLRENKISYEIRPEGRLWVRSGSAVVNLIMQAIGEHTVVRLIAPVTLEVSKISSKLTRFLVEENNELLFGKFSLDVKNKTIYFEHALLGDFLDADELLIAVIIVAELADKYDEEVSAMAGGKRFSDL